MRVLFVVPTDYDAVVKKGVAWLIDQREEDGELEQVITVHPFAINERSIAHSPRQTVYEFRTPAPSAWRIVGWLRLLGHILRTALRIRALARSNQVDIVRAQDPYYSALLAWLATRFTRARLVISLHADYRQRYRLDGAQGAPEVFGSRALAELLERVMLRQADGVLPIRESLGRQAMEAGVPAARIHLIPHGINLAAFAADAGDDDVPLDALQLDDSRAWLVFGGRLSRENYVADMLEMGEQLSRQRDDFLLVLAGDGPERAALSARLEVTPQLSRCCRLVGPVAAPVMASLRRHAAVGIVLMGGLSLIEACAAGRPVCAYDVEWHHELVENGVTGYLVEEADIASLATRVAQLLDDPTAADAMGAAARKRAFTRHSEAAARGARMAAYRAVAGAG
ncbi:MAG: glycosyltransferase [Gammaproteobacteria bacterium]|nr:glycosyltransferase [Gammaproteobacteria bacterium]